MLVLHPGFAKTATTTLQQAVFPRHSQIHYLGVPAADPGLDRLLRRIPSEDSTRFDTDAARAALLPHLEPLPDRRVVLLSCENLTLYEAKDKGLVAARLRTLFGQCRIMFTLRRQEEVVASWYLQKLGKYLRDRRYLTPEQYFHMKLKDPSRSILDDVDYDSTIACYERLFGRDCVSIVVYEQLRADPQGFSEALAGCLGVDATELKLLLTSAHLNSAQSQRRVAAVRIAAKFLPRASIEAGVALLPKPLRRRLSAYIDSGRRARVELGSVASDWIGERCRAGNRRLDSRYGGALARYGYTL